MGLDAHRKPSYADLNALTRAERKIRKLEAQLAERDATIGRFRELMKVVKACNKRHGDEWDDDIFWPMVARCQAITAADMGEEE